jgi:hypothetical protein
MPLDPVIAGGYRGVEIPNPMNQLAQLAQLQQLRDANALRQMQMEEYARARSEEAGIRQLFAKPDVDVSSPDFQRQLLGVSPKTGAGILKAQGELQTAATKRAEIDAKTLKQHIDLSQNQLAGVTTPEDYMAWHEANHRDPVLKKYFESRGITAEQSRARIEAALQRPGGLQQLIRESALGMEKALEMATTPQDLGGTKRIIAMPKFGRPNELAGAVVPGSEGTVTAAPASAYDQWRMQNQSFTIENTANGLVRVDKTTGAVTPLTMNNLPLMGNVNPQVIQGPNGPMVVQPNTGMAQPVMQPAAAPGGAATPVGAPLPESLRAGIEFGKLPPTTQGDVERYRRSGTPQPGESAFDQAVGAGIGRQVVADIEAARTAPVIADRANSVLQAVDTNKAFMGSGADFKLNLARALNVTGNGPAEQIAATEKLIADLKESVIAAIKSSNLGTGNGFTDKDLKYLADAKAADIAKDPRTLRTFAQKAYLTAQAAAEKGNRLLEGNAQIRKQTGVSRYEVAPMFQSPTAPTTTPGVIDFGSLK